MTGCVTDFIECNCGCHTNKVSPMRLAISHVMACCSTCKYCGKNIKELYIQKHIAEHEGRDHVDEWGDLSEDYVPSDIEELLKEK